MHIAKIVIAVLVATCASKEACVEDDVTSLLQNQIGVSSGASRSKVAATKSEPAPQKTEETGFPRVDTAKEDGKAELLQQDLSRHERIGMLKMGIAEFVAMTWFVFLGCGSAMALKAEGGKIFQVSLVFGLAITSLAYSIGHLSGGQINCAVSFGLVVAGHLSVSQALINTVFQLLGAICGSFITTLIFSEDADQTGSLGTNAVSKGFTAGNALIAEVMGTFLLVFVVLETAINSATTANHPEACLAIGLAVFLAHSVLIPVDGCSINPTRSFGPMVVRKLLRNGSGDDQYISDHWIFWVGPLIGAGLAGGVYRCLH